MIYINKKILTQETLEVLIIITPNLDENNLLLLIKKIKVWNKMKYKISNNTFKKQYKMIIKILILDVNQLELKVYCHN